mgnify:CR=1 FL=1
MVRHIQPYITAPQIEADTIGFFVAAAALSFEQIPVSREDVEIVGGGGGVPTFGRTEVNR